MQTPPADFDLSLELNIGKQAAKIAGEIMMGSYDAPGDRISARQKPGHGPVTDADIEIDRTVFELIQEHFPGDAWRSEELGDKQTGRSTERVWIVDPIDGTREFVNKIPEFSFSLALAIQGEPALGIVYNPVTREMFSAVKGTGAFRNRQRSTVSRTKELSEATLLTSFVEERKNWYLGLLPFIGERTHIGSIAYKLALVSAGKADGSIALTHKSEWDVAAGVLMIKEAGGLATTIHGETMRFNKRDSSINGFVAGNQRIHAALMSFVNRGIIASH